MDFMLQFKPFVSQNNIFHDELREVVSSSGFDDGAAGSP